MLRAFIANLFCHVHRFGEKIHSHPKGCIPISGGNTMVTENAEIEVLDEGHECFEEISGCCTTANLARQAK